MLFKYILPIRATQLNYSMRTGWLADLSILEKDWLIKTWVIFHQVTEMESFFGLVSLPSPSFSTTAEHFHHLKKHISSLWHITSRVYAENVCVTNVTVHSLGLNPTWNVAHCTTTTQRRASQSQMYWEQKAKAKFAICWCSSCWCNFPPAFIMNLIVV